MRTIIKIDDITKECIALLRIDDKEDVPIEKGFIFIDNTKDKGLLRGNINKHNPCKGFYYNSKLDKFIKENK